jgi:hypothetical protein
MQNSTTNPKWIIWTSYALQGIVSLLLLMAAANNLAQTEMATKGAADMGYPSASTFYLGLILLIALVLYNIPRTCIIGAILLTGWLGGAVATHVIHADAIGMVLFPAIFGAAVWTAIGLRSGTLNGLIVSGK